jgi:chromosomal replication initiation ATPase DnaA
MEQEVVMEDSRIVAALSADLAQRIGAQRFDLWFGEQTKLCIAATQLTVRAASTFLRDCLRKYFAEEIRACWKSLVGDTATVEFEADESIARV